MVLPSTRPVVRPDRRNGDLQLGSGWAGVDDGHDTRGLPHPRPPPRSDGADVLRHLEVVKLRAAPSTGATVLSEIPAHTRLTVLCLAQGGSVDGPVGPDTTWERVADALTAVIGFVADEYVLKVGEYGAPSPPAC